MCTNIICLFVVIAFEIFQNTQKQYTHCNLPASAWESNIG